MSLPVVGVTTAFSESSVAYSITILSPASIFHSTEVSVFKSLHSKEKLTLLSEVLLSANTVVKELDTVDVISVATVEPFLIR